MKGFDSLAGLAAHMTRIALQQQDMERQALEKVAKIVKKRAKAKIGEYQEQAGPFIAWPELADATKSDRARKGYPDDEPLLRSGGMRDSIGHAVADGVAHVGSNDEKAVWQELGTSKIPPRSFLGGAAVESMAKVLEIVGESAALALAGEGVHDGKLKLKD